MASWIAGSVTSSARSGSRRRHSRTLPDPCEAFKQRLVDERSGSARSASVWCGCVEIQPSPELDIEVEQPDGPGGLGVGPPC
jgi:hypothetical protein